MVFLSFWLVVFRSDTFLGRSSSWEVVVACDGSWQVVVACGALYDVSDLT